jgi:hypothetical protein
MIIIVASCMMFIMLMVILYIAYTSLSQPKNKAVAQGMKKFKPILTRKTGMIPVIKQTMQPGSVSALNSNIETIIPKETRYNPSPAPAPSTPPAPAPSTPPAPAPSTPPAPAPAPAPAPSPAPAPGPTPPGPAPAPTPTPGPTPAPAPASAPTPPTASGPAPASTPPTASGPAPASASTPPAPAPAPTPPAPVPASAPTPAPAPASAPTPPAPASAPAPAPSPAPPAPETSLYEFTTHTFTNAGATGRIGPTLSQIQIAYTEIEWTKDRNYLNMVGNDGIQIWTVPKTGKYLIQTVGASGNPNMVKYFSYGHGADIQTTVKLNKGQKIKILVGQYGDYNSRQGEWKNSGGGGGSFVVNENDNEPIIIAGGGGGSCNTNSYGAMLPDNNTYANIGKSGFKPKDSTDIKIIYKSGNGGDEDGYGGGASKFAGGGGGFYKDGDNCEGTGNAIGGSSFFEGSRGGISGDSIVKCDGGFGGGGGGSAGSTGNGDTYRGIFDNGTFKGMGFDGATSNFKYPSGGGGGGYSGGGGGGVMVFMGMAIGWWGGGGGSYSNTPITHNGYNNLGHGKVVITFQSP